MLPTWDQHLPCHMLLFIWVLKCGKPVFSSTKRWGGNLSRGYGSRGLHYRDLFIVKAHTTSIWVGLYGIWAQKLALAMYGAHYELKKCNIGCIEALWVAEMKSSSWSNAMFPSENYVLYIFVSTWYLLDIGHFCFGCCVRRVVEGFQNSIRLYRTLERQCEQWIWNQVSAQAQYFHHRNLNDRRFIH